jgi:carbonic anhydrase
VPRRGPYRRSLLDSTLTPFPQTADCLSVANTHAVHIDPRYENHRNGMLDRLRISCPHELVREFNGIRSHADNRTFPADSEALLRQAVRANIRASANQVRHGSKVLEELIQTVRVLVVGAEYSLETGGVDFFDGVPEAG